VMERSSTRMRLIISVLLVAGIARGQALPGHTEPYDFFIQVLIFAAAGFAGLLGRTHRAYLQEVEARAERAEAEREQQAALEATRAEEAKLAVADERLHIAQELHDVLAHTLSVIAVQAGTGAHVLDTQPEEARRALENIAATSRASLGELPQLLGVLRSDGESKAYMPAPCLGELDRLVAEVTAAGVPVQMTVEGSPDDITPGVELAAYRIVQEALTNVLKHAGPARTEVTVGCADSAVTIEVTDDGPGNPAPPAVKGAAEVGGGQGLAGMRERIAVFGGDLRAGPRPGGGFTVRARLPAGEPP